MRREQRHGWAEAWDALGGWLDARMMVVGVDVGSVRRPGGFSWAAADGRTYGADDPSELGRFIVHELDQGGRVAVAFECPLAVPVLATTSDQWRDLGRARVGEGNRSWSAGAGTGALATGLVQLAWLCRFIVTRAVAPVRATTELGVFLAGGADLFITEAMVTADGKPEPIDGLQDHADAVAAARRLADVLEGGDFAVSDVRCQHSALNLAATACLHAGMNINPEELRQDVLVAKTRPAAS